jgi:hypothetical protein
MNELDVLASDSINKAQHIQDAREVGAPSVFDIDSGPQRGPLESAFARALSFADTSTTQAIQATGKAGVSALEASAPKVQAGLGAAGLGTPDEQGRQFAETITGLATGLPDKAFQADFPKLAAGAAVLAPLPFLGPVLGGSIKVLGAGARLASKIEHPFSKSAVTVAAEGAAPAVANFKKLADAAEESSSKELTSEALRQYTAIMDAKEMLPYVQKAALSLDTSTKVNKRAVDAGVKAAAKLKALPKGGSLKERLEVMEGSFSNAKMFLNERVSPGLQQLDRHLRTADKGTEDATVLKALEGSSEPFTPPVFNDVIPDRPDKALETFTPDQGFTPAGSAVIPVSRLKPGHALEPGAGEKSAAKHAAAFKSGKGADNIVVEVDEAGGFTVLSGNGRLAGAIEAGVKELPAHVFVKAPLRLSAEEKAAVKASIDGGLSPTEAASLARFQSGAKALETLQTPEAMLKNPELALPVIAGSDPVQLAGRLASGNEDLGRDLSGILLNIQKAIGADDRAAIEVGLQDLHKRTQLDAGVPGTSFEDSFTRLSELIAPDGINGRPATPEQVLGALNAFPDATPAQMSRVIEKTLEHMEPAPAKPSTAVKGTDTAATPPTDEPPVSPPRGANGPQQSLPGLPPEKPTFKNVYQWYVMNEMINFGSDAVNIVATASLFPAEIGARTIAGATNQVRRLLGQKVSPNSVAPTDAYHFTVGALSAVWNAIDGSLAGKASVKALVKGQRTVASHVTDTFPVEHAVNRNLIPSMTTPASAAMLQNPDNWFNSLVHYTGHAVGITTRLLLSGDQFLAVMSKRASTFSKAHQDAYNRAIEGGWDSAKMNADYKTRLKQYLDNPAPNIEQAGDEFGRYFTLNNTPGPIGQSVLNTASLIEEKGGALGTVGRLFTLPFFSTLSNSAARTFEYTPLVHRNMERFKKALQSGDNMERQLAHGRAAMGALLITGGVMLAKNSVTTGQAPDNTSAREQLKKSGWVESSINLGNGVNVRLDDLGVVGNFLKFGANLASLLNEDYFDNPDTDEILTLALSTVDSLMNFSFLRQTSSALSFLAQKHTKKDTGALADALGGFAGTHVPLALRRADEQLATKTLREANDALQRFQRRIPFWRGELNAHRDMYGNEVPFDVFASYLTAPNDPFIDTLNSLDLYVTPPGREYEGQPLTDAELEQRQIHVGAAIKEYADSGAWEDIAGDKTLSDEFKKELLAADIRKVRAAGQKRWKDAVDGAPLLRAKQYKEAIRQPIAPASSLGILR